MPVVPGVEHRQIDLSEVRIHLAEAGDGPPLLLLHGWPQNWWCWRHLIPRLAEDYRVLAPDLRGWGWSGAPPGDYAKQTFANDIVAMLDSEGIDRAPVIGHDWGGYIGFLLALDHPERVERLVALDIAPPWLGPFRPRHLALPLFASYQALLATPVVGEQLLRGRRFVPTVIKAGSGTKAHWSDHELDLYTEVLTAPARARASSACYRTFLLKEAPAIVRGRSRSGDLDVPTLLMLGGDSPLRLALDPRTSRNVTVVSIDGAGHFLPEEAPEEVLALTGPFLSG